MNAERYHHVITALGMTPIGAGDFLGIDPRTSRRYASGEIENIPTPTAMLLEFMLKKRIKPAALRRALGMKVGDYARVARKGE